MEDALKTHIGGQIAIKRKAAKLTQEQLAQQIEMSSEAISNIERGLALPSVDTLLKIAKVLELPLVELLPEDELVASKLSVNRLKLEAEAQTLLRGLDDKHLGVAIAQIGALTKLA